MDQDALTLGDPLGRMLGRVAAGLAILGGLVLSAITLLTVASIVGRTLFDAPVSGDFELVEIGMAAAIFAFLPYCQITRGNVVVDLFTTRLAPRTRATLDAVADTVFALLAAIFAWRAWLGGADVWRYAETSMVLRLPVWWGYVPAVLFLGFLAIVCAYTAWRGLLAAAGRRPLPGRPA